MVPIELPVILVIFPVIGIEMLRDAIMVGMCDCVRVCGFYNVDHLQHYINYIIRPIHSLRQSHKPVQPL